MVETLPEKGNRLYGAMWGVFVATVGDAKSTLPVVRNFWYHVKKIEPNEPLDIGTPFWGSRR